MDYLYDKMNEMQAVLNSLELPKKLANTRAILTLLAIAKVENSTKWTRISQNFSRIHDIISFINANYPNKGGTDSKRGGYKENSRETIRDDTVTPFCSLAILEHNGEKSQSGNSGYRITVEFASLLKTIGTDSWEDELTFYKENHKSYAQKYNQKKRIDKGLPVSFDGKDFTLTRTEHNRLQLAVLENWAPHFVSGAKLVYIGDTKKREIVKDDKLLKTLQVSVLDEMLPDIILYHETEKHKWLIFIEAYTSTGEFTVERITKIKDDCQCADVELIFVTAFKTMNECKKHLLTIAWDTEIWIAEEPTHMIHKNGDKFLGGHED